MQSGHVEGARTTDESVQTQAGQGVVAFLCQGHWRGNGTDGRFGGRGGGFEAGCFGGVWGGCLEGVFRRGVWGGRGLENGGFCLHWFRFHCV